MDQKIKSLPIALQAMSIRHIYKDSIVSTTHDQQITWTHTISPSPLGGLYLVRLVYHISYFPKMYVIDPRPLPLASGNDKLPHCYDQRAQRLCLYFPDGKEWNKTMLLATTVIPWAYEWLYHYEIWLGTGEWTGGGAYPQNNLPKKQNDDD